MEELATGNIFVISLLFLFFGLIFLTILVGMIFYNFFSKKPIKPVKSLFYGLLISLISGFLGLYIATI